MSILSGEAIVDERELGRIVIEPFDPKSVNPNSYNFHLDRELRTYEADLLDPAVENPTRLVTLDDTGYVLEPGRLYLGATAETLGGRHYAPTFAARSSVARLGLFINLSASLGDIGYVGQWTLQLYATAPIRVYPHMAIGQMMWWLPRGPMTTYSGKYQGSQGPTASLIHKDLKVLEPELVDEPGSEPTILCP